MVRPPATQLRKFSRILCVVVSVAVFGWVLHSIDVAKLPQILLRAKLFWIAGAWAVFGVGFLCAAARWHLVLRLCHCQVHAGATFRTVLVGHLFNTLLFGPTGGDIAKAALYSRWFGFATSSILATCVLDRFLGGVGFFAFASSTPGLALHQGQVLHRVTHWVTSPRTWVITGLVAVLALGALLLRQRLACPAPLKRIYTAMVQTGGQLLRRPKVGFWGVVLAVLSHLCISSVFLFSLKAVTHTEFSWRALLWVFPVISIITSAPVTFAGTGLREGAALFFLSMYGIPAADAVGASILVLLTYFVWAAIGGAVFWRHETRREQSLSNAAPQTLSLVIPTLNEAEALPETVAHARQVPEVTEIIVVDGGSKDLTRQIAAGLGCRVMAGPRGRGAQLRLGASQARGEIIALLHADTWLTPDCGQAVRNCLRDPIVVGGGFWKVFREKRLLMIGSRFRCALRLWLFGRVLGDQVIFVRRNALEQVGGVPDLPLMEEFELCRRLRQVGRLALAGATVTTSARRFTKGGVLRTYLRMGHVTLRYYCGTPSHKLRDIYEKKAG